MPVEVHWYKDTTHIIYTRYSGIVSLDDVQSSIDLFANLTQEDARGIHSIIDVQNVETFPTRLKELHNISQALKDTPDQGFLILVGATGLLRFVGNIIIQVANLEYRMVDTLEEAEAILARI